MMVSRFFIYGSETNYHREAIAEGDRDSDQVGNARASYMPLSKNREKSCCVHKKKSKHTEIWTQLLHIHVLIVKNCFFLIKSKKRDFSENFFFQ